MTRFFGSGSSVLSLGDGRNRLAEAQPLFSQRHGRFRAHLADEAAFGKMAEMAGVSVILFQSEGAPAWLLGTDATDVEARVAEHHRAGSARWPTLALSPEAFAKRLARHLPGTTADYLGSLHATDFFLASACAEGLPGAAELLAKEHFGLIPTFITRVSFAHDREKPEDVVRSVEAQLLVADGSRPARIGEYSGKGSLGGWLRVVAVRIALNANRKHDPATSRDVPDLDAGFDIELAYFKERYRAAFKAALEEAFARLEDDDRLILRLHSVGTRGDEIARVTGVDRSTVMRRLARARQELFAATKRTLMQDLKVTPDEFESIARAVVGDLDLSLSRLLPPLPGSQAYEDDAVSEVP